MIVRRALSEVPHGAMVPDLLNAAGQIRRRADAPYSKFTVGAAILTHGGSVFVGCNVESADYDGTHAEEAALAAMQVSDIVEEAPQPVSEAVNIILREGPVRFADIHRRVTRDFPRVRVTNVAKAVGSALTWGTKTGRYMRETRGVYRLA